MGTSISVLYTSLNYFPFYLRAKYGYSETEASTATSLVYVCTGVAPFWGAMADAKGRRLGLQTWFGAVNASSFLLLYLCPVSVSPYPFLLVIGLTFAMLEQNAYAILLNLVPEKNIVGTACGLLGVFLNGGLIVLPLAVSWSFNFFGRYVEQNILFAIWVGTAAVLSVFLCKPGLKSADTSMYATEDATPKLASRCFALWVSALFGLIAACAYYNFHFPGAVENAMKEVEGWSVDEISWLFTIYSLPNVAMPFVIGVAIDRFGTKTATGSCLLMVTFGSVIFAIGCDMESHSSRFAVAMVGRTLLGLGGESAIACYQAMCEQWFSSNHLSLSLGVSIAVVQVGGSAASFFLGPVFDNAVSMSFSRWTGVVYCGVSIVAFLAYYPLERANADYLLEDSADEEKQKQVLEQNAVGTEQNC